MNKTKSKRESYVERVHDGRIEIMEEIEKLSKLEEPQSDENYREPLSVDSQLVKKITLSTGGPADGFKLYFDLVDKNSPELSHGVYWRADWGTYEESQLSDDEVQRVFDFYLGGYCEL